MTPRAQRRLMLAGALVVILVAFGVLASGALTRNLVPYHDPSSVLAAGPAAIGPTLRLGGQVAAGTLHFDEATHILTFSLTDDHSTIPVETEGAPPDMFREGIGALVEGKLGADGVFHGARILVKHSNEYRAPQEGKHPTDIYQTVEGL
ncbi:MAG: cytochrome c maturation protein CcmE [Pseudomonadota bacterium]